MPLISIITVVFNGRQHLEQTIISVLGQTYKNIEFIIIDGGSTDGTVDIIRNYEERINYWHSEPDRGIYDAMNKGTDRATGDWTIFLNAGDVFADTQTLSCLMPELCGDTDILFGRHEVVYDDGYSRTPPLGDLLDLWKGMVFCHQSMLVRTSAMKSLKFNIDNRIAADYEFIFSLYAQRYRFRAVNRVIASIIADGFSAAHNIEMIRAQRLIAKQFTGRKLSMDCYYLGVLTSVAFKNLIKRCLPRRIANHLRSRPWR